GARRDDTRCRDPAGRCNGGGRPRVVRPTRPQRVSGSGGRMRHRNRFAQRCDPGRGRADRPRDVDREHGRRDRLAGRHAARHVEHHAARRSGSCACRRRCRAACRHLYSNRRPEGAHAAAGARAASARLAPRPQAKRCSGIGLRGPRRRHRSIRPLAGDLRKRFQITIVLAVLVGGATGAVVAGIEKLINDDTWGTVATSSSWWIIFLPTAGLIASSLLLHRTKERSAETTEGYIRVFHDPQGRIRLRSVPFRPAASSYVVFVSIAGTHALFAITAAPLRLVDLAGALLVGLACGLGARLFIRVYRTALRAARRLPYAVRPVVGGVVLIGIGAASLAAFHKPFALGPGYEAIGRAARGQIGPWLLLALLAMKIVGTTATASGNGVGGLFFPSVLMGAALGGAVGH